MTSLYDIIYNWFASYVFATANTLPAYTIGGTEVTQVQWLSHTATIVVLVFLCLFLFLAVKWLFRLFAGLIGGIAR